MNVFDAAMKMELEGKAYYEQLAAQTDLPGLQAIFRDLARDEQKHYEAFRAMKDNQPLPELTGAGRLAEVKSLFRSLPKPGRALKSLKDSLSAYRHAMNIEAESRKFYEQAAGEEKDPQVREALLTIAAEEQQHYDILDNVYQFANAPNQYLAGAEISNLQE